MLLEEGTSVHEANFDWVVFPPCKTSPIRNNIPYHKGSLLVIESVLNDAMVCVLKRRSSRLRSTQIYESPISNSKLDLTENKRNISPYVAQIPVFYKSNSSGSSNTLECSEIFNEVIVFLEKIS